MTLFRPLGTIALVGLSGCAGDPQTEGGIIDMTDASMIAETGFPMAAVLVNRSRVLGDGTTENSVQFDPAKTNAAQIAAAPAALCNGDGGRSVVSSRLTEPGPDDVTAAGSKVLTAICK